ncbi:hypothetical protein N866_20255 [Actinotalea ferrariae CF5-4]|uniref:Uncharacterized protein n=1 Tax=Actinotalea ferrariae CF5-4 TaxID=948458 RepID=A0A021VWP7_9CELL|nr:hypothetical protein [Actinotalea ferrariae]EYR63487.1 hypothetical protein N866_20255 [Actinotalea ferrariae CF5-4]
MDKQTRDFALAALGLAIVLFGALVGGGVPVAAVGVVVFVAFGISAVVRCAGAGAGALRGR